MKLTTLVVWLVAPVMSNLLASGDVLTLKRQGFSSAHSSSEARQAEKSLLHGSVRDEKGAVVWPASVEVTEITNDARTSQNVPSSGKEDLTASAYTGKYGEFRITLAPGFYQVCAGGGEFPRYCRNIRIESGKEATADFVVNLGPADSEVMDQRLRKLAGTGAIDCGHVSVNAEPQKATTCAIQAFRGIIKHSTCAMTWLALMGNSSMEPQWIHPEMYMALFSIVWQWVKVGYGKPLTCLMARIPWCYPAHNRQS